MRVEYGEVLNGRKIIADFIVSKKVNKQYKVIDIGGSAIGWSLQLSDAFVDINKVDTNKTQFNIDICKEESWKPLLQFVELNDKFNFSICTHTLEDIYNPYLVLDYLPKISKAGVITMPSIKCEINLVENSNWSGFLHHRYLFGHKNNKIIIAPKLPVIEKLRNKINLDYVEEIRYWWENSIEYEIFMNNYLGPNTNTVLNNLETFLKEQI